MAYNIIRKHSDDSSEHIIETVSTKREALKTIVDLANKSAAESSLTTKIQRLGQYKDIIHVTFTGLFSNCNYSISYWFEKA